MIKKQQKWIALLVTLTFMWLLQVSTMPIAANAPEQISSVNAEQAPRFIEEEGNSGYQAKGKSILPIVLGVVVVGAVAAVLFLVVLKTKYDIRGTWTVTATWGSFSPSTPFTLVFTGSKETGTFKEAGTWNGTYTVDGKNATWIYTDNGNRNMTFTGKFTGKDSIEGTMTTATLPYPGTFTAVRTAGAAGTVNSGPGGKVKEIK